MNLSRWLISGTAGRFIWPWINFNSALWTADISGFYDGNDDDNDHDNERGVNGDDTDILVISMIMMMVKRKMTTLIVNGHCNFRPDIHFLEINVENMYQVGLTFDDKNHDK